VKILPIEEAQYPADLLVQGRHHANYACVFHVESSLDLLTGARIRVDGVDLN
jgi:hypothetical protein